MITKSAPAKLNLNLHVTGRLANGYHTLESLVVFTEIIDVISISEDTPGGVYGYTNEYLDIGLILYVESVFVLDDDFFANNLIYKAAKALADYSSDYNVGNVRPAHISLKKQIPLGAGLGGGSSDAAATLNGLNEYWQMHLSTQQLRGIAATLGSDISGCIEPKAVWMSGTGNELAPTSINAPLWAVVIYPGIELSAKTVYQALELNDTHTALPEFGTFSCDSSGVLIDYLQSTQNHLTEPAIHRVSEITEVLEALNQMEGAVCVRMSGSGSACFGLFASEDDARAALLRLSKEQSSWWPAMTKLVF